MKAGRSPRWRQDVYMDISRIKADTGYAPRYTVATGVQDYVAWLQAGNAR
jgi:UDP-glucose 4-epimerase